MKKACACLAVLGFLGLTIPSWTDKLQAQQPAPSAVPAALPAASGSAIVSPDAPPTPAPSWRDRLRLFGRRSTDNQEVTAPATVTADVKPAAHETASTRNLKQRIEKALGNEAAVTQVGTRPNGHLLIAVKVRTEAQVDKVTGKIYAIPELGSYQLDLEATIETVGPVTKK
jgi:hypothetical protein